MVSHWTLFKSVHGGHSHLFLLHDAYQVIGQDARGSCTCEDLPGLLLLLACGCRDRQMQDAVWSTPLCIKTLTRPVLHWSYRVIMNLWVYHYMSNDSRCLFGHATHCELLCPTHLVMYSYQTCRAPQPSAPHEFQLLSEPSASVWWRWVSNTISWTI